MQNITKLLKKFGQAKKGISNVIVVMLSLILIVLIVSNVVLWSYQMNQFDLERMQENIRIANVTRVTRSPWFTTKSEYAIERGNNINGTYKDTWLIDDFYETFREEAYYDYHPSAYNTLNLTRFVSGSLSDLQSNDESYMIFRSYHSAFSEVTATFGNTANGTGTFRRNTENTIVGSVFTLTENGEAQSITAYIGMTVSSKNMKCAIYRYSDLSLVAQTEEKAPAVATTWVTFNFINKPILTANTKYLLVAWSYSGTGNAYLYYTNGTDQGYYRLQTYGANFPDPLPSPTYEARAYCIYCTYKPVVEETVETEFIDTSNNDNWTQLVWTIDSCFTTTDVTATFQLYNYHSGQYPTGGDGYMTDIIGNTDITKTQIITTNSTYFRDSSGNWKLKVKGVKATNTPFDLKVDFVEFKTEMQDAYALSIIGEFSLDISTYPLVYIDSIEIQIRFRANDTLENWTLNAYNWTSVEYDVVGQVTPTTNFEYYTINLTEAWQSYVNNNGTIRIKFCDVNLDANQTTIDIDFFAVRAVIDGACFNFKNNGSTTVHIVSIWIINATNHQRYNANLFINAGEETVYIRADISLPEDFIAKVVTERGNIAVFTQS